LQKGLKLVEIQSLEFIYTCSLRHSIICSDFYKDNQERSDKVVNIGKKIEKQIRSMIHSVTIYVDDFIAWAHCSFDQ